MYVCVCNAVTERDIGEAVSCGASTLRHLRQELGVADTCGRCATHARDCLRTALAGQTSDAGGPCLGGAARSLAFTLAVEAA